VVELFSLLGGCAKELSELLAGGGFSHNGAGVVMVVTLGGSLVDVGVVVVVVVVGHFRCVVDTA
jgi:hypothetical protein